MIRKNKKQILFKQMSSMREPHVNLKVDKAILIQIYKTNNPNDISICD